MELYKQEFGQNFNLGFDLSQYPWLIDKSWHNDVSPSFYFNVGQQYYVLWVDYVELSKRETSNERYLIQEATNEGDEANPEVYSSSGDIIFENELIVNLNQFLTNLSNSQGHIVS
ncbi:Conserved hypothetical protein [Shewanella piezotolerans WP3]|uniref:Uncharacterized protein n=1 Tax=Shewanella piezotolerans (strain WP3 / JCM 13877) TaxID=225849 RepID=B8CUF4_SHEPW|nr:hypothetical protein [Shewanella piezotolerans]ACJ31146.1 Conserved hypothetical protein [Shewanella piezotolerans WP3]